MTAFPGGIENAANGALILSLVAAAIYLFALELPRTWKLSAAKTFAVASLAWIVASQHGPMLLVGALALSALGDFFLSRDGERFFLAGLASFLAAHIAYVFLFFDVGGGVSAALTPLRMSLAAVSVVISVSMLRLLWTRVDNNLRAPIVAYVIAIQLMGLAALTTALPMVISGAFMFMASDTILALERFVETDKSSARARMMRVAVWVLYYVAQVLITLGSC